MPRARTVKPPESETPPEPAHEPAAPAAVKNQSEAVRAALAAGHDMAASGVPYIRETFGMDIKPTSFSAVKANEKKKAGVTKAKRGRKPREKAEWAATPTTSPPSNGEADIIGTLESLKPLVASMGADKVKRLVDLLG